VLIPDAQQSIVLTVKHHPRNHFFNAKRKPRSSHYVLDFSQKLRKSRGTKQNQWLFSPQKTVSLK